MQKCLLCIILASIKSIFTAYKKRKEREHLQLLKNKNAFSTPQKKDRAHFSLQENIKGEFHERENRQSTFYIKR